LVALGHFYPLLDSLIHVMFNCPEVVQ
jgi:hypothetical protein